MPNGTIKDRIGQWARQRQFDRVVRQQPNRPPAPEQLLHAPLRPEPDIEFRQAIEGAERVIATIEIKGGKDPAGALERLGAIQKSFEATPPGCTNMLIAGVVTAEMAERLDQLGIIERFLLDDLTQGRREMGRLPQRSLPSHGPSHRHSDHRGNKWTKTGTA